MRPHRRCCPATGSAPRSSAAAPRCSSALGEFEFAEHLIGGASIDAHGTALTDEVLAACRGADAVLLGAVGGPKWDTTDPDAPRPEQGLLGLRKGLGLYANLRPVRPSPALVDASPLRAERIAGTDLLVVRELTGGIYFGDSGRDGDRAHDTCAYTVAEIERIAARRLRRRARPGGGGGRRASPRSTRPTCSRPRACGARPSSSVAGDYPDVELDHLLVDNAAMQLVSAPGRVRRDRDREPVRRHPQRRGGDAHRLARHAALGQPRRRTGPGSSSRCTAPRPTSPARASPTRSRPSSRSAMMLRHGLDRRREAAAIEAAVDAALERGPAHPRPRRAIPARARSEVGTEEMTAAVLGSSRLRRAADY